MVNETEPMYMLVQNSGLPANHWDRGQVVVEVIGMLLMESPIKWSDRQCVTRVDGDLLKDRLGVFLLCPSCLGYWLGVIEAYKYFLNNWIKTIDSAALFKNGISREETSRKFPLILCHQMLIPFSVLSWIFLVTS